MLRRKLFLALISLIMVFAFMPFSAFATDGDNEDVKEPVAIQMVNNGTTDLEGPGNITPEPDPSGSEEPASPEPEEPGQEPGPEGSDPGNDGGLEVDPPEGEPEIPAEPTEPVKPAPHKTPAAPEKHAVKSAGSYSGTVAKAVTPEPSYELTVVGQEQAPLAKGVLDSDCCVLHLILMVMAFAALLVYAWDMRRRQTRIFELEQELGLYEIR